MDLLKLNRGCELDATKQYLIDIDKERESQLNIMFTMQLVGAPKALEDWWKWLEEHNFSQDFPDVTNESVKEYYGKKPLWKSEYSQGIVVRSTDDDDYYVVMECSRLNEGYKSTQVVLTLDGCL